MDAQHQLYESFSDSDSLNIDSGNTTNPYTSLFIVYIFYDLTIYFSDILFNFNYLLNQIFEANFSDFGLSFNFLNFINASFESKILCILVFVFVTSFVVNYVAWKLFSSLIIDFKLTKGNFLLYYFEFLHRCMSIAEHLVLLGYWDCLWVKLRLI
jgi:hypothetical protein